VFGLFDRSDLAGFHALLLGFNDAHGFGGVAEGHGFWAMLSGDAIEEVFDLALIAELAFKGDRFAFAVAMNDERVFGEGVVGGGGDGEGVGAGAREWFFDEDVFAGFEGGDRELFVQRGWEANVYHLDLWIADQFHAVGVAFDAGDVEGAFGLAFDVS